MENGYLTQDDVINCHQLTHYVRFCQWRGDSRRSLFLHLSADCDDVIGLPVKVVRFSEQKSHGGHPSSFTEMIKADVIETICRVNADCFADFPPRPSGIDDMIEWLDILQTPEYKDALQKFREKVTALLALMKMK